MSSGLKLHPDGSHLIYPVGCTIVIEKIANKQQEFLTGHTNTVSCLALSKRGDFIASGQVTYMGFKVTDSCALATETTCTLAAQMCDIIEK